MTTPAVTATATDGLTARRWALGQVPDWPEEARQRLETVVGELVANALEHGRPPVGLRLERPGDDRRLRLTVRDHGSGPRPGHDAHPRGPRERGRGLAIVRSVGGELRSTRDGDGYEVQVELGP
jgi:anti-sigma regulatory factor (Ser/Thr protein kinase)